MFCNKCGQQVPHGAVSCPACGARLAPPAAPRTPAVKGVRLKGFLSLPDLILLAVSFLCFIAGFLPWLSTGYAGASLVSDTMFSVSAMLGVAKIFAILGILLYPLCLASFLGDLNRLLKIRLNWGLLAPLAYFGVYFLSLFFSLVGCIATDGVHPGFWWYAALLFCGCGAAILFFLRDKMAVWFRKK